MPSDDARTDYSFRNPIKPNGLVRERVLHNPDHATGKKSGKRVAARRGKTDRDQQRQIKDGKKTNPQRQPRLKKYRGQRDQYGRRNAKSINLNLLARSVSDRHVIAECPGTAFGLRTDHWNSRQTHGLGWRHFSPRRWWKSSPWRAVRRGGGRRAVFYGRGTTTRRTGRCSGSGWRSRIYLPTSRRHAVTRFHPARTRGCLGSRTSRGWNFWLRDSRGLSCPRVGRVGSNCGCRWLRAARRARDGSFIRSRRGRRSLWLGRNARQPFSQNISGAHQRCLIGLRLPLIHLRHNQHFFKPA